MPEQSDDYNRAAKQVIHRVQVIIVEACRKDPGGVDEKLGKLELRAFLAQRRISAVEISSQLDCLAIVTPQGIEDVGDGCFEELDSPEDDGFGPGSISVEVEESVKEFYVSFTLKKKFARLHRMGGCHRTPGKDVHSYFFVDSIHEVSWDDFCRQCWRLGAFPGNEQGYGSVEGSGSSSEGSSSTGIAEG